MSTGSRVMTTPAAWVVRRGIPSMLRASVDQLLPPGGGLVQLFGGWGDGKPLNPMVMFSGMPGISLAMESTCW